MTWRTNENCSGQVGIVLESRLRAQEVNHNSRRIIKMKLSSSRAIIPDKGRDECAVWRQGGRGISWPAATAFPKQSCVKEELKRSGSRVQVELKMSGAQDSK